jgi:Ricin-type beta-trefoil lectin domain-like
VSKYYFIQSKLNDNVIDIQGSSRKSKASLDAFPLRHQDNQLWEFVQESDSSTYYYIKSKLSGNVINIDGLSNRIILGGTGLDADPKNASLNELWQFVKDPDHTDYCYIMGKGSGMVIDIEGNSEIPGTILDASPLKASGTDNQLWRVVNGSFPTTVPMASTPSNGLGSNSNYILYNDCNAITNGLVSIYVTEDIVCKSVAPPTTGCKPSPGTQTSGFSFQLNCYSKNGFKTAWQQFVMSFWQNASGGLSVRNEVNCWDSNLSPTINTQFPTLTTLTDAKLPAGYRLDIGFFNKELSNSHDPINQAFWSLFSDNNTELASANQVLTDVKGVTAKDLAPITAFELNVVGPVNGEISTLSSGSGYITYVNASDLLDQSQQLFVSSLPPGGGKGQLSCTETTTFTCETANTFYGKLPHRSNVFTQSFEVSTTKSVKHRQGTAVARRLSEADRRRILGFE